MNIRLIHNPLFALATLALSGSLALSQQAPPPPASPPAAAPVERQTPPSPGMRPGMRPGMMQQRAMQAGMMQRAHRAQMMHGHEGFDGGFHIAPPGMWWKDPRVVQTLTLTPDQTAKMDGIFQQSRLQLIDLKANVEKAQVTLEPMLSANPLDTAKAMAQIDKVAQARADLEKADAKMLLGIRAVLTPDQWTKLRAHAFGGPDEQGAPAGPGRGGPGGGPGRGRGPRPGGATGAMDELIDPIDQP